MMMITQTPPFDAHTQDDTLLALGQNPKFFCLPILEQVVKGILTGAARIYTKHGFILIESKF
jgi:hypothetical protein